VHCGSEVKVCRFVKISFVFTYFYKPNFPFGDAILDAAATIG